MVSILSHKDLIVWQKTMDLAVEVYARTEQFPTHEQCGVVSHMRRAVVSIPSNIAEGYRRGSRKEYRSFLLVAFGSIAELDTQIDIAVRVGLVAKQVVEPMLGLFVEVAKMLNTMIRKLRTPLTPNVSGPTPYSLPPTP